VVVTITYTGTAADGSDYTAETPITIPAGQSSVTFDLSTLDDAIADNGETIVLTISTTDDGGFEALELGNDSVTTTIIDNDTAPTIDDGSVVVSEEGLNIPSEDKVGIEDNDAGAGYDDETNDVADSGSLSINGNGTAALVVGIDLNSLPTGLESGGDDISWTHESGNQAVAIGSTPSGTEVIRIELNNGVANVNSSGSTPLGSINYSVSLSQPVDHGVNSLEDTLSFDFSVYISDGQNTPVDTGTVSVTIEDDMPSSSEDEQSLDVQINTVEIGGLDTAWSNPQGGDSDVQEIDNGVPGQDDVISWDPSNYTFDDNDSLINNQNVAVNSTFEIGEFTHNNYPTDTGNAIDSVDLDISFEVSINGYTATVNHTISFLHDETPNSGSDPRDIVTINNASTVVPITITTAEGVTETYNFEIIGFIDENGNVVDTVYTNENASNSFKLMGQLLSSDAPEVTGQVNYGFGADGPADEDAVSWDGMSNGVIQGAYGVLTVDQNGNYSYQLDQDAYDALSPNQELTDSFTYTLKDADGDGIESTLDININGVEALQAPNLIPEAQDETVALEVGGTTSNLVITLDVSGSMDSNVSGTGKTRFEIAQESLVSTIQSYQQLGETEVNLTLFGSNATNIGWMSASDAVNYINSLELHWGDNGYSNGVYANGTPVSVNVGGTDYKDAVDATEVISFASHSADQTIGYFLSDGEPNDNESDVNNDNDQTIQDWKSFIEANVDELHVVGIGSNVSDEYLEHIQVQDGKDPIMVTDESQLVATLNNTATVSVQGDVSDNYSGGDGVVTIDSITVYGVTYTADGSSGTTAFPSAGIELDGQGTLLFDFTTGSYSYSAQSGEFSEGLTTKEFSVTVSDEDGDDASFNVNIEITALDTTASAPVLEGDIDGGTLTGSDQNTVAFSVDDEITLRSSSDTHTYDLPGVATSFSLKISNYRISGKNDDDGQIKLYSNGQIIATLNLDDYGDGTVNYSGSVEFDQVVVTRSDGRFDIFDFTAPVSQTVDTYEYDLDLSAALTDTDGSETLSAVTIDGLPTGASVTGTGVTDNGDGTYTVELNGSGEAGSDVILVAGRQLTQVELDGITISVTATETSTGHQNTVTATLVDGIVAGVAFATSSGLTGMTDDNGAFEYREGDSVAFMIGSVVIGTATPEDLAAGQVFLQDLADVARSDLNDEYVENMAVLLQSLDADGNASNGISITASTHAALDGADIDLRTVSEADLKAFIEGLGEAYVTEEDAMAHVREMLEQHAGVTQFDEHQDDSIQTATLAHEVVTGLTYQTTSGLGGELNGGAFSFDEGDTVQFFANDVLVAEFDSTLVGGDGVITFEEAGFSMTIDELQQLFNPAEDTPEEEGAIEEEAVLDESAVTESEFSDESLSESEPSEDEITEEDPAPVEGENNLPDDGSPETDPTEEDHQEEPFSLLYEGDELGFADESEDEPEDEANDLDEGEAPIVEEETEDEEAEQGEPLALHDVLSGEEHEDSVDNLLGGTDGEQTEQNVEPVAESDNSGSDTPITDIDTGTTLENLTGGISNNTDV
jgi:VCBS repeat-containing protein